MLAGAGVAGLAGCGIEGLIVEGVDVDHERPRTTLLGRIEAPADFPLDRAAFEVLGADGEAIEVFSIRVDGDRFDLGLAEASYPNARLRITVGGRTLLAVIPEILEVDGDSEHDARRGLEPTEVTVSIESTVRALLLHAMVELDAVRSYQTLSPGTTVANLDALDEVDELGAVTEAVGELFSAADFEAETSTNTPALFQWPSYSRTTTTSFGEGLTPDEIASRCASVVRPPPIPFCDASGGLVDVVDVSTPAIPEGSSAVEEPISIDGSPPTLGGEFPRRAFDRFLVRLIRERPFRECFDTEKVRVVLEVNFNEGRVDGLCNSINRFKWVRDEPGKRMFFVGGVHETSPIQDTEIDAMLGNQGSWSPNTVPMYDDGTNGDAVAGDNVWTITYILPRGLRIGYKYTWGTRGAIWTGSEEWPGNQRILEVVDVNDDGIVYRQDNFADEATNKDLANNRTAIGGVIEWTTDADGDGIYDVRERHDLDNDCVPDPLTTPSGAGPATVPPNPDGTCPGT